MLLTSKRESRDYAALILTIPVLVVIVISASYLASPLFQQRLDVTHAFTLGAETGER